MLTLLSPTRWTKFSIVHFLACHWSVAPVITTGFASLKYLVWKSAGDSSLALSRSISTLSQWATGWIIGLSDKNIYGSLIRSKLLHFKLYVLTVPIVWLDSINQNHGESKPPLMAYVIRTSIYIFIRLRVTDPTCLLPWRCPGLAFGGLYKALAP